MGVKLRRIILLTAGQCSVDTWMTAAKQEPPVKGKPANCKECPLRIGGEWDENTTAALATATPPQRGTLRKRWGCHAAPRPCAGMARIVAKLERGQARGSCG